VEDNMKKIVKAGTAGYRNQPKQPNLKKPRLRGGDILDRKAGTESCGVKSTSAATSIPELVEEVFLNWISWLMERRVMDSKWIEKWKSNKDFYNHHKHLIKLALKQGRQEEREKLKGFTVEKTAFKDGIRHALDEIEKIIEMDSHTIDIKTMEITPISWKLMDDDLKKLRKGLEPKG